jgi:hypothetical protein
VVLNRVDTDRTRNVTHVAWDKTLTHGSQNKSNPSTWTVVKVFAFRQKASLFGHNAPNPNLFVNANDPTGKTTSLPELINHGQLPWTWKSFQIGSSDRIDLDASYPKIVVGGWFALVEGVAQLYKVKAASAISRADFALSGKVTELAADFGDPDIAAFQLPTTDVWAQSDQLDVAEVPLDYPLYGAVVPLAGLRIDLAVALSGRRQKIAVRDGVMFLRFVQGSSSRPLQPGEILTLSDPAPLPVQPDGTISDWNSNDAPLTLYVEDARGRAGTVTAALSDFTLAPSDNNDPIVSEYALLTAVDTTSDPAHARLLLAAPLGFCYDRFATTVNANVGLATHGQTVSEILGSGDPTTPNQTFPLKQSPLTYVQAATPTGRSSTLTVRVSGVDWSEVASLYEASPSASVYTTFYQADGSTEVVFGDGIEGALLPTGQSNLQATYRVGSGAAGNVAQGALATLIDRPLGVSGVTNPAAATGGQDPQSVDDIRANAPLSVLTLGRAVSIVDYENFARSFAGIAKAHALWIANGPGRGVFLTVSGSGGAALPPGNPTLAKLLAALQGCSNPLTAITTHSYVETLFSFSAELRCDPAYDRGQVESDVRAQLVRSFGFAARAFGQAVGVDELTAIIQGVPGVVAVNVTGLARGLSSTGGDLAGLGGYGNVAALNYWLAHQISLDRLFADTPTRLCAYLPVADAQTLPQPAEILVLDPDPAKLVLGAMS